MKALQSNPRDRYPDAASFAAALRPFADRKAHELSRLDQKRISVGPQCWQCFWWARSGWPVLVPA